MDGSPWTDEEIKFLEDNWMSMSASNIGDRLGRTKNSIIGKSARLGLKRKQNPGRRRSLFVSNIFDGKEKGNGSIYFSDAEKGQCLYMSGTDGIICGKKVMDGSPYCEECHAICYKGKSDVNTRGLDNETSNSKISMKPWR